MTALVARQPLHPLLMSATQRPPRRLSARIQEKDDPQNGGYPSYQPKAMKSTTSTKDGTKSGTSRSDNTRKRKKVHDEEDDGFVFTRMKKKKQRDADTEIAPAAAHTSASTHTSDANSEKDPTADVAPREPPEKRRKKMSFSTPNPKDLQQVRRSKRLSSENDAQPQSPPPKARRKDKPQAGPLEQEKREAMPPPKEAPKAEPEQPKEPPPAIEKEADRGLSGTTITLPFADTPVIRRNKAMRENKSGKGERRSSLSMRGRRASSLIESGNSNALPHTEVEVPDFYKHIECDGLPEPRRMRQLLTWCATRALDAKPIGTGFEDASAVSAARVIEEEMLKELSNRSELSDWFARDDVPVQPKVLPERPNPKNQQNAEKIIELEEQIKRLRAEKDSLKSLLRPPTIPQIQRPELSNIDIDLLSEADSALLQSLQPSENVSEVITQRLDSFQNNLGPIVDSFADGVHKIGQYRDVAENVAGRILSICSEKLAERDRQSRKRALPEGEVKSPKRDLNSVLRGLSRVDR